MATFDDWGLSFDYPDDWTLDVQPDAREPSVMLQTPGSGFVMVTVISDRPTPTHVLDTAQTAFEEEYADCEVELPDASLAGVEAEARDIDFTCHDLVTTARMRAAEVGGRTLFLLAQRPDIEADEADEAFAAMEASVTLREAD